MHFWVMIETPFLNHTSRRHIILQLLELNWKPFWREIIQGLEVAVENYDVLTTFAFRIN